MKSTYIRVHPHDRRTVYDFDSFTELCERDGIRPAAYLARAQWVGVERFDTLSDRELKPLVTQAYELTRAKLPKSFNAAKSAKSPKKRVAKKEKKR